MTTVISMSSSNTPRPNPKTCLIRISVINRGTGAATLHLLPTLWFRNTWIVVTEAASKPMLEGSRNRRAISGILAHHTDPLFQESLCRL